MGTTQLLQIANAIINPAQVILATWHEDNSLILTMAGNVEQVLHGQDAVLMWNALSECCALSKATASLMTVR